MAKKDVRNLGMVKVNKELTRSELTTEARAKARAINIQSKNDAKRESWKKDPPPYSKTKSGSGMRGPVA